MTSITEIVSKLADSDQATAYRAVQALRMMCYGLLDPAKAAQRAELAGALAGELTAVVTPEPSEDDKKKNRTPEPRPRHGPQVRNTLLRALSIVGGEAEVPAIARALGDLDLREMARYALERNRSEAATDALCKALDESSGDEFRIGILNTLGRRGGPAAVAALRKAAGEPSPEIRLAAVEALANIPDAANDAAMALAAKMTAHRAKARTAKARIRLAEKLLEKGDKAAAKRIYDAIPADLPAQRKAADLGAKRAE